MGGLDSKLAEVKFLIWFRAQQRKRGGVKTTNSSAGNMMAHGPSTRELNILKQMDQADGSNPTKSKCFGSTLKFLHTKACTT